PEHCRFAPRHKSAADTGGSAPPAAGHRPPAPTADPAIPHAGLASCAPPVECSSPPPAAQRTTTPAYPGRLATAGVNHHGDDRGESARCRPRVATPPPVQNHPAAGWWQYRQRVPALQRCGYENAAT